jgi:hypothetical protein
VRVLGKAGGWFGGEEGVSEWDGEVDCFVGLVWFDGKSLRFGKLDGMVVEDYFTGWWFSDVLSEHAISVFLSVLRCLLLFHTWMWVRSKWLFDD